LPAGSGRGTPASAQALFLEQYLDRRSVRLAVASAGRCRSSIVEVGNSRGLRGHGARSFRNSRAICTGYSWAFGLPLRNSFPAGLEAAAAHPADPRRDGGVSWGTYYDQDPVVMAGKISLGLHAGEHA
jgi:hypothetical protein